MLQWVSRKHSLLYCRAYDHLRLWPKLIELGIVKAPFTVLTRIARWKTPLNAWCRLINNLGGKVVVLCNTLEEVTYYQKFQYVDEARYHPQWALTNTEEFRILPQNAEPEFDFVFTATLQSYKRHHLLKGLNKHFRYALCTVPKRDKLSLKDVGLEPVDGNPWVNAERLTPDELSTLYANCYCGLMLSEIEGACRATIEYLLTGLPVVTTPAYGGRFEYLDGQNSVICESNAESISTAIKIAKERKLNREEVRNRTLEIIQRERNRLCSYISALTQDDGFRIIKDALQNGLGLETKSDANTLALLK